MISKRSFFKKLSAVIAAVAIAPEIAFRAKLKLPEFKWFGGWDAGTGRVFQVYKRIRKGTYYVSEIISEWEKNHA